MSYRDGGYRGQQRQGGGRREPYGRRPFNNPRFRREGGGGGYGNQSRFQQPGRGRGYGYGGNRQRGGRRNQGMPMVGAKRQYYDDKITSTKRQRTSYSHLPLTTVILAQPGDKTGKVPKLVFSGFYDCTREAKVSRSRHYLQLNISRKSKTNRRSEDRVSIPVPFENIAAVAVLSGMNPFEEMIAAHSERDVIKTNIENYEKEITKRLEAYAKKSDELGNMPEIEQVIEEVEEVQKTREVETAEVLLDHPAEEKAEALSGEMAGFLPQVENVEAANLLADEEEKARQQAKLERKQDIERRKRERDQQIAKRARLEATVIKLEGRVEEAQQKLASETAKLEALIEKYGAQLSLFEDETEGAEEVFLEALREGMGPVVHDEPEGMTTVQSEGITAETTETTEPPAPEAAMAEQPEPVEGQEQQPTEAAAAEGNVQPVEVIAPETSQEYNMEGHLPQPSEIAAMPETAEVEVVEVMERVKISERPVRLLMTLKKPLDKFYASNTKTTICDKEVIENTEMIIMEYNPKHTSQEDMNLVNDLLEGPWKDVRRTPEKLLDTPYSAEKTLQYLIKSHKRKEISDNIIEKCPLCGNSLKRMVMEKHLKQFCMMREEPCRFCGKVLIWKNMKEHHLTDCPRYIVSCPQRCFQKNLERCQIPEHLKTCMNTIVDCRYKCYGCKVQVKRKDVSNHMYDDVAGHLDLLQARMELLTSYLMSRDPNLGDMINPPVLPEPEAMVEDTGKEAQEEKADAQADAQAEELPEAEK